MIGNVIWIFSILTCAILFLGIGIYAWQRKDPMWFWSGSSVSKDSIKDIPAYNKANGIMWIVYSFPYWICVITYYWCPKETVIFMLAYAFLGLGFLIYCYLKIENKYKL